MISFASFVDTSLNCLELVYCFGIYFSSLLTFAFERQNMTFTGNELLTCILNCDAGLGYD